MIEYLCYYEDEEKKDSLCVVTLLAGCGGSGNKSESKTCSITQNGMTLAATFNAKDDEIKTADMNVTVPASALGGVDLSTLSDDQKKMMQTHHWELKKMIV